MIATQQSSLNAFDLLDQAEVGTPPERRGLPRDGVRLMTVDARTGEITHLRFSQLGDMLQPGDLLAVPASGAYQLSMSNNYNAALRPAVVWVEDGQDRLIQRRETLADLMARDVAG